MISSDVKGVSLGFGWPAKAPMMTGKNCFHLKPQQVSGTS